MSTILIADDNPASRELLRGVMALRALQARPDTYLVALTALAMDADRARILAAGFDRYMAKPISVSGIRTLVREILAGRASNAEAEK